MPLARSRVLALRIALGSGAVFLLATSAAAAGRRLHDPDLDLADAAIEKAEGLLQLTSCAVVDDKATKECQKAVAKALADLADAREQIDAAAAATDGGAAASGARR